MNYYPVRYLFRRFELLRILTPGVTFLEIGSGEMMLSLELLRFFDKGRLVDYNENACSTFEKMPSGIKKRLSLDINDIFTWESPEKYNCIIACEVMEHIRDDGLFLRKISSLMKPSGQLILSVPSRKKYWSIHDEIVGHLRRYEKDEIVGLLCGCGFEQISIISYGFPFVNLLRLPRIILAKQQGKQKSKWNKERQTKESGFVKGRSFLKLIGIFINPFTVFPFALLSSLFNNFDLSDGYVITAKYPGEDLN